jgi:hypothetical protein
LETRGTQSRALVVLAPRRRIRRPQPLLDVGARGLTRHASPEVIGISERNDKINQFAAMQRAAHLYE